MEVSAALSPLPAAAHRELSPNPSESAYRGVIRVAYCIDSMGGSGGTELNAIRTAERLDPARFALTVFTLRADGPMRARYEAAGIAVRELPVRTLVGVSTVRAIRRFARILRDERFDVVHAHDVYTNWVAILAGRLARRPAVIASKRWTVTSARHRTLNRLAYRLAHRVLANSTGVAESLAGDGVPARRVVTVPNFVEDDGFATIDAGERAGRRAELGIAADAPVVGILARLRPEKDLGTLLRATARLRARHPDVRVVLVGDGECEAELRALAGSLDVADHVVFAGHRPSRPSPHALFDVSVLCSTHEGFPNTLVEAMAAGRPVVATRVGGVPDAVADGTTGLLVPPHDPEALAGAIGDLLDDPARAHAMGEAGRVRARTRFHVSAVIPLVGDLYTTLTADGAPRRPR